MLTRHLGARKSSRSKVLAGGRAPPALVRLIELEGLCWARCFTRRHEETRRGVRGEAVLKWERAWRGAKAITAGREGLPAPSLCFKQEKSRLPSRCWRGQHVTGPLGAPSPCPAHVHPGFLDLPEATLATPQPPSLQLLLRILHAHSAWKQRLCPVWPPGTERRCGFTHRRAHKCQGAVSHTASSTPRAAPAQLSARQAARTALQSRHRTGGWQQDLSPAPRGTVIKQTRLRGRLPSNYLKRKSKPMATSHAHTQEGTA